jgi:hypothetical protein
VADLILGDAGIAARLAFDAQRLLGFGGWFVAQTGTQERLTRVTGHAFRPRIPVRLPSGPCPRLDLVAIRGTVWPTGRPSGIRLLPSLTPALRLRP